jgi:hypothetical protein
MEEVALVQEVALGGEPSLPMARHHAAEVSKNLQAKATRARQTAYVIFVITMLIALGILSLFLFAKQIEVGQRMIEDSDVGGVKSQSEKIIEKDITGLVLNTAVVRIGAVLVGIFVIQILTGFCRYYFRLAEHLSACAEVVLLGNGNSKTMTELASVLLPQFDFGKLPSSPVQKIVESSMDTVKELTKRIPVK